MSNSLGKDGSAKICSWCQNFRMCQEALGFAPGGAHAIAGFACDPCVGKYGLSFMRDNGSNKMLQQIVGNAKSLNRIMGVA